MESSAMPYQWTTQAIEERLGISMCAFPALPPHGAREVAAIREAGFSRIEIDGLSGCNTPTPSFDFRNRAQMDEILAECRNQGVTITSVHAPGSPAPGFGGDSPVYDAEDSDQRREAVRQAVGFARLAEEMGASILVAHFGVNERSARTVTEVLEQLADSSLKLTVENVPNVPDLRDYMAVVDRVGSEQFGMTVDIGHARDSEGINPFIQREVARSAMAQCGKRLFHLHLHDFTDGDHIAPFLGRIEWEEVFAAFADTAYAGSLMFEVGPFRKKYINGDIPPSEVLRRTAAFPATFAERYVARE